MTQSYQDRKKNYYSRPEVKLRRNELKRKRWRLRESTAEERYKERLKWVRYRYGVTADQYNFLLEKQNGVCAICKQPERVYSNLSVDHNHKTNKVRELLCSDCNKLVGFFELAGEKKQSILEYLTKHSE